jgi:hypothetical protein
VIVEVRDIVDFTEFDPILCNSCIDPTSMELGDEVDKQLQSFATAIMMPHGYHAFHGFEHACHVGHSAMKLLSLVIYPTELECAPQQTNGSSSSYPMHDSGENGNAILHKHSFGLTSDVLVPFALIFSALIHDIDHPGVSNAVLVKENSPLVAPYGLRSLAEQNSLDVAWNLFMTGDFRTTIYRDKAELDHFRELVVNLVMATDIRDDEMANDYGPRWSEVFVEKLFWKCCRTTNALRQHCCKNYHSC